MSVSLNSAKWESNCRALRANSFGSRMELSVRVANMNLWAADGKRKVASNFDGDRVSNGLKRKSGRVHEDRGRSQPDAIAHRSTVYSRICGCEGQGCGRSLEYARSRARCAGVHRRL